MPLSIDELKANFEERRKTYDIECDFFGGSIRLLEPDAEVQLRLLDHGEVIKQLGEGLEPADVEREKLLALVRFMQEFIFCCAVDEQGERLFDNDKIVRSLSVEQVVYVWSQMQDMIDKDVQEDSKKKETIRYDHTVGS
jgi:hypothetical protein